MKFYALELFLIVIAVAASAIEAQKWSDYNDVGPANGKKGRSSAYVGDDGNESALSANSPKSQQSKPPSRGGIGGWGIIAITLTIIFSGIGIYYFVLFYPIVCKKERMYDVMEMTTVIKICRPFIIEDDVLKLCVKKFADLIPKSLAAEGQAPESNSGCREMHVWDFPDGSEMGHAIGLDFSGKVFRLAHCSFVGGRVCDVTSKLYEIPEQKLQGSGFSVVDYVARCVANFVERSNVKSDKIILGMSLGFPFEQESLQEAVLLRWSGDFKCDDFIREDFFARLRLALKKFKATKALFPIAVTSDTTANLLAGMYKDPNVRIGVSAGYDVNLCYVEKVCNISRYSGDGVRSRTVVGVDFRCFDDDGTLDFMKTEFDRELDNDPQTRGNDTLDKLIAGRYMGELLRLCLVKLITENIILNGVLKRKLKTPGALTSRNVAQIEGDGEKCFDKCRNLLRKLGYADASDGDCLQIRFVARCIARRSANILASFLIALVNHLGAKEVRICSDGYLVKQFPGYGTYLQRKMRNLKRRDVKCALTANGKEDPSLGAGLLALMYRDEIVKREEKYRLLPPAKPSIGFACNECEARAVPCFART